MFGPQRQCLCGNEMFIALIYLDEDNAVAGYMTDGRCAACGADITIATEID